MVLASKWKSSSGDTWKKNPRTSAATPKATDPNAPLRTILGLGLLGMVMPDQEEEEVEVVLEES